MGLKNIKLGNVSITILVIGIFGICALALITFIVSGVHVREGFVGIGLMEKINYEIEEYGVSGDWTKLSFRVNSVGDRILYQERIEESSFLGTGINKKEKVVFSVEYKVP
jgi:hypothetical protein